jgi:hypothetical protein
VRLTKCQIIITTGVYFRHGPSGSDPWPSGQRGRPASPTPWPAGWPGFEVIQIKPWLPRVYTKRRSPSWWRPLHSAPDHVAWLTGHHLAPNRPLQVSGGSIHPYKYPPPPTVKVEAPQSTCSSPLVKVPV